MRSRNASRSCLPAPWVLAALVLLAPRPAAAVWPHAPGSSAVVCGATGQQQYPAAAGDGMGGAFVAWDDSRAGTTLAYVQHVDRYGREQWASGGLRVSLLENYGTTLQAVPDGLGGVIVAWYSVNGPCVQRFDAAGNRLWGAGGVSFLPAFQGSGAFVAADGSGGCVVTWLDNRGANTDVYAQRVAANGTLQWTATGVPVCTATGQQYPQGIVSDGQGGVVVAWTDQRGGFVDIYAQRLDANGTPRWAANGVSVASTSTANRRFAPNGIVADGAGGAILVWTDERSDFGDIYAQRLDGFSNRRWGPTGLGVGVEVSTQYECTCTTDGLGGVIVAWSDNRAANQGIYAQRVNAEGAALWTVNGVALASPPNGRHNTATVSDGQGGAFVGWRDFRAYPLGAMYARRIDAQGVPGWTADGVKLGSAGFEADAPEMVASEGGVIGLWFHNRGDGTDIVGQRVDTYGYLGAPEPRIASVQDVPNDQGGRVKVSWDASWLDTDPSQIVQVYLVLRSVPAGAASEQLARGGRVAPLARLTDEAGALWTTTHGTQTYYWELIGSASALHFVSGYGLLAPTTGDSTGAYNPRTAFMVVAQNYSGQYWLSAPDSGYSVDDLAPAAPAPFTAEYGAGVTRLHWSPNAEADLAGYRLYRGDSPGFVPGPSTLVSAQPDTGYADAVGALRWYKLTALDLHGNESPVAVVSPTALAGAPGEAAGGFAFAAPSPNPARVAATLRFTLPREGAVRLAVFDAGGRLVRTLRDGPMAAGAHAVSFDLRDDAGRALPAGLYLARCEAEGRAFVRRLALTR